MLVKNLVYPYHTMGACEHRYCLPLVNLLRGLDLP